SRERTRRPSRLRAGRLPRRGDILEQCRGCTRTCRRQCASDQGGRCATRSEGRRLARLVRPLADGQGGSSMTMVEAGVGLNDEQFAAVDAEGSVFVSAGAGTGKTSVLVERYLRAVCDRGIDVESILVITYTRKAAGELRGRIRSGLRERGRPDL